MKQKLFAIVTAFSCLFGMVSAQSYSIRVVSNTNLRASNSLNASIVETVSAGTTLTVLGEVNRWLRIDRNGRDLWMASWVRHERVEGSQQTQSQTTSTVDNCCFVDRQCSSDQDWTNGYWAFQNGQCAAPAQTLTSTQPVSTDVGQADNCCQIGWQCHTDNDWLEGFYAFQENRCKHRGLAIEGSAKFIARVEAALDLLKARSPNWYDYAVAGLNKIREVPNSEGAGVYVDSASFSITPGHAYTDELHGSSVESAVIWVASIIVHDSCHVHRYRAGLEPGGLVGETACLITQIEAMDVFNPGDQHQYGMRGLLANIENVEYQWWH